MLQGECAAEDGRWRVITRKEKRGKKIRPLENGGENEDALSPSLSINERVCC